MTKILVIEDEDMIRHNLVDALKMAEYDVIEATNGSQGIALTQSFQPDLVICEIMMPDLNGDEVLKAIRNSSNPTTAVTPFIFLSPQSYRKEQSLEMEMGRGEDYLPKPCPPEVLLNAVAAHLETQGIQVQQDEQKQMERSLQDVRVRQKRQGSHEDILHQLCQDFRDPLANMTMAIEMLKVAPEEGRDRYLQIMQQECARQKALVNQLAHMGDTLTSGQGQLLRNIKLSREG